MTATTRRFVFFSLLVLLLTVPAEIVLLRAITTPDQKTAVREWVADLGSDALSVAAARIQAYPVLYRREIMGALPPEQRSAVWRRHLQTYVATHSQLDTATVALIDSAARILTPAYLDRKATDAERDSLHVVAEQIEARLGRDEAEFLLARLGPRDGTFASFEPLAMYLSNKVRSALVVGAQTLQCDCSTYFGCYDLSMSCQQGISCAVDNQWPGCGWAWSDNCDGLCVGAW